LFAAIGTVYGAGDNVNTFNLPNYKDCVLVGAGGSYVLQALPTGATRRGSFTKPVPVPNHTHALYDPVTNADLTALIAPTNVTAGFASGNYLPLVGDRVDGPLGTGPTKGMLVRAVGSDQSQIANQLNVEQPGVAVNICIKT